MENATKALLIAAAVLIAILIISLTLVIYRQGSEAVTDADLSEAQQEQFNGRFTVYEGSNVSTAQVNALFNSVLSHNQNETNTGSKRYVTITASGIATQTTGATSVAKVSGNAYYTVKCTRSKGLVTGITITKNP